MDVREYSGLNIEEVTSMMERLKQTAAEYEAYAKEMMDRGFHGVREDVERLPRREPGSYSGKLTLTGFISGHCRLSMNFEAEGGQRAMGGDMHTTPISVFGFGVGSWKRLPRHGEKTPFTWWGGAYEGGVINLLVAEKKGGDLIGGLVVPVTGIGAGVGHGEGRWD